jgi:hypothetical protein
LTAFSNPIVVRNGVASLPPRIALRASEGAFSEAWLQKQLFQHPLALPIQEIAPNVGAPIPICMELNTLAGPADILYVTASGQVVLVETKLWRNPEARREVIAQILDYAKELTAWRYEDLSREVARATGQGPEYLLQSVRRAHPDLDEVQFVDGINHNLRTGDVLLLVVGDGIRTGAEALVAFLERYGSLRFTFGLVEVAAFDLGEGDVLLQPRVLAKTEVMRRVIVLPVDLNGTEVATVEDARLQNAESGGERAPPTDYQQWMQRFWTEYLQRLKLDEPRQPLPKKVPRSTNVYFSMPPPGGESWVSAYLARSWDQVGVYLTWMKTYPDAQEAFEYLFAEKESIEEALGAPLEWKSKDGTFSIAAVTKLGDWSDPENRERVMQFLLAITNRFVNAFRPRLEAFLRAREQR